MQDHDSSPVTDEQMTGSVQRLFERQVRERPHAVAVTAPERDWTYRELNEYANRIANRLRNRAVAPGDLVAISVARSPETLGALLGILKVGAAYVPLDASYPDERLRFMLEDTGSRCLIADEASASRLGRALPIGCELIRLEEITGESPIFESYCGLPEDLHSILYTSGSTGTPKGVMIMHSGVIRLVINPDYVSISPDDVFSHLAPFSFDTSLFEIFGALLNGARLMVLPASMTNFSDIAAAVTRFKVTTMWLTSGLFSALMDTCPDFVRDLRYLLVGGDVVSVRHARKALALMTGGCLIDGYGPTENTTFSTAHRITPQDVAGSAGIPIGKAIRGSGAYVLNDKLELVQGSEEGEIYVTGWGLARGYWNRPELTAERFFEIEIRPGHRERAYKTGDLGRYLPDGSIAFLGRIDLQVKIRGFRIELTEIEACMADCPAVAAAVVVPVTVSGDEDKYLRLCYVLKPDSTLSASNAEAFLRERLPAQSIPSEFVVMDCLPLDPNGKVHRRQLSQMQTGPSSPPVTEAGEPLTAIGTELLGMMRELLKLPHATADDDFFLMGGHSLLAARLFSQIEARWKRRLPLAMMLQLRTARKLAEAVERTEDAPVWSSLVPLRAGTNGKPVFLLHAIGGNVIGYRELAMLLPAGVPVYGIQARGLDGVTQYPETVEQMAAEYVDLIRSVQPEGPYVLCGFSAGGVMAFEVASQLEGAGQTVALIGLIDSNLRSSVANTMRTHGLGAASSHAYHVIRWNLWYATQIGVGNFLAKKIRNTSLNLRIVGFSFLNRLRGQRATTRRMRLSVEEAFLKALRRYTPGTVQASAILFHTADSKLYDPDQEAAWRRVLTQTPEVCTVTGTHDNMLEPPNVNMLMANFVAALDRASDPATAQSLSAAKQNSAEKTSAIHAGSLAQ
jgi:amino acid adenylation domain-containing protein